MRILPTDNIHFGMAVKATPEAKEFLSERLTRRGLKKLQKLTKFAENDSVNVNLSTRIRYLKWGTCPDLQGAPYTQLVVNTGDKGEGYEPDGMSFCIIRAIKRAVNDAHFLSENKKTLDTIL